MKRLKDYYVTIVLIIIVIFINIGAFGSYISNVKTNLGEQTDSHIDDIMDEAVECVNIKLEEQLNMMKTLTMFAGSLYQGNNDKLLSIFEEFKDEREMEVLEVVSIEGSGELSGVDYSEDDFYLEALEGKTVMKEKVDEDGLSAIYLASPIYFSEESDAPDKILISRVGISKFSDYINISSVNNNGKVFVVEKDGTLISKSNELKSVSGIDEILPESKYEKLLINSMRSRNSGIIKYEGQTSDKYLAYSKLDYNKWYIVCIISSLSVEANISDVTNDVIYLGIEMAVMLIALVGYLIYNVFVVRSKGNMNLERYYIVSEHSDAVIFDYSVLKDTMYCNEKWEETFGYALQKENVKSVIKNYIHEDDIDLFNKNMENLFSEKAPVRFQCRIYDADKKPVFCLMKAFPISEKMGKITKVIGMIDKIECNMMSNEE